MALTIAEALELEIIKDYNIEAGREGLSNIIKRVGILDHETGELVNNTFSEGQFVLTTLFVIKDDIEKLLDIVNCMISLGVSGLAIRNVYFKALPEEVIRLADENSFPIIIYDNIYFEDIIAGIFNAMKEKEENEVLGRKIDALISEHIDAASARNIALDFNREFRENCIAVYIKALEKHHLRITGLAAVVEKEQPADKVLPYNEGAIIIFTFEKYEAVKNLESVMRRLERLIDIDRFTTGISSQYKSLSLIGSAVRESLWSCKYGELHKDNITVFRDIGISRMLIPLLDNPWVLKYHEEVIGSLSEYDRKNSTELLETASCFVKNNGSIKAAALELHQHENTIRYRIDKIYKVLGKSDGAYEELAVAVKINNLMQLDL